MIQEKDYTHVSILVVGAGPGGLAAAIAAKSVHKDADVVILEKGESLGDHNLSGAVLETAALKRLLDEASHDWLSMEGAGHIMEREVKDDDVCFLLGKKFVVNISLLIKFGKKLGLSFGEMDNSGDHIVSISKLTRFLGKIAISLGIEVYTGFGVKEILYDQTKKEVTGVKLVDQGLDKKGHPQPNYRKGETITADIIILAEGADGLVTEDLVVKAGLKRQINQVFSVGVKEIIRVSKERYESFGNNRVVHTLGYPLWFPLFGPDIFGGGFAYSYGDNQIAVGIIAGADWKYCNFNPQKALEDFKRHAFIRQFIEGSEIIEAGVKMIPEGGYYALPRYVQLSANSNTINTIGYKNVMVVGDSAGFVNMHKIKGLHNAIESGLLAGKASIQCLNDSNKAAEVYTHLLEQNSVMTEMKSARNFRAIIAKFGSTFGFPFSIIGKFLPRFGMERDFKAMTSARFKYDIPGKFDKATFVALAGTKHREDQPAHLSILDQNFCINTCDRFFDRACITFCPGGVYEQIGNDTLPANPSNCIHCKTCQRKCPFDNIRWTVPEGGGGPRYKQM
ncbi:MAG: FAD-binding protein [Candidatus Brocadia sp. AMX2]|uniref:Electron transfer flavoprotein-ubiquinone oxidoreductase n=1 Tax=Candidatus Brocadia sinica JPN1 TaxID=1197129 RepID=A0ABQ0JVE5_9BACT|nr:MULTISPECIES: electron-transfer flavoprotein:ubiquinone oxidoreductase [Brocadia]MBC6930981.1 FAD-binding protein [Candidatus Brocadia sp.]MBL1167971.1 FAD-binding protein [Candidatus Brocadia sp. AMX1]NOG41468.1 FAD-dependent oxidoreductase [Planctomycetota bacterium]GIK13804.1 MAG: electron-transferring-flavoprotein dehydrogenase [Candidatus Brocadia sinica]KAA0245310.1 MAG: FAD-binding protein [Candidatus Brocadia sp. AMX2]